ncbi:MAG: sigma-54 dependent transcriptional regulator [Desulfobacteraceae bacterium]
MKNEKETILVVEDEDLARRNLVHILTKEGYGVVAVENGIKAIEQLKKRTIDLVVTDFKMARVDGMKVLQQTKAIQPYTEVIIITGYATIDLAVRTVKSGAFHYIAKPYKIDELRKIVKEAIHKRQLRMENHRLEMEVEKVPKVPFLVGKSSAIKAIRETIRQIAASDSSVLILGESGTGKELVAKAIHHLSRRSKQRFMAFNCGSLTEELMANELFGHEKGAFTGATQQRCGLIEAANNGTLFLDEIGDMPISMQVKLLRVIQEKEFLKVGGVDPIAVDVRFLAATHRDLQEEIQNGQFRQDLYYRLNIIMIKLPPLIERDGDISLLTHHFLKQMQPNLPNRIDQTVMELLCQYSWPGNVRELENVIERAVTLAKGNIITEEHLPDYIRNLSIETYRFSQDSLPTLEDQEKHYIQWVLDKTAHNKTQAAKIMGIDRVSLWRKMKRFGME